MWFVRGFPFVIFSLKRVFPSIGLTIPDSTTGGVTTLYQKCSHDVPTVSSAHAAFVLCIQGGLVRACSERLCVHAGLPMGTLHFLGVSPT